MKNQIKKIKNSILAEQLSIELKTKIFLSWYNSKHATKINVNDINQFNSDLSLGLFSVRSNDHPHIQQQYKIEDKEEFDTVMQEAENSNIHVRFDDDGSIHFIESNEWYFPYDYIDGETYYICELS